MGALAGYFGGRIDDALMRFTEFFQTIPSFLFAIVLVAILLPSFETICIAIAVVSWPPVARLVRGEVLSLRSREFVLAAVVAGQSPWRIITRQILPNTLSPIIVTASMMVASAILLEGALSFLGLGDPNMMSWGFMVGAGRTVIRQAWWICFFPGLAIMLTVLALNLVGEGLNDALEPAPGAGGALMTALLEVRSLSVALAARSRPVARRRGRDADRRSRARSSASSGNRGPASRSPPMP